MLKIIKDHVLVALVVQDLRTNLCTWSTYLLHVVRIMQCRTYVVMNLICFKSYVATSRVELMSNE